MITVVYAVYAIGVIASLFLGGHVSDWVGRRRLSPGCSRSSCRCRW
jgi:MFS family permease